MGTSLHETIRLSNSESWALNKRLNSMLCMFVRHYTPLCGQ